MGNRIATVFASLKVQLRDYLLIKLQYLSFGLYQLILGDDKEMMENKLVAGPYTSLKLHHNLFIETVVHPFMSLMHFHFFFFRVLKLIPRSFI